jgi:hypothetical protein
VVNVCFDGVVPFTITVGVTQAPVESAMSVATINRRLDLDTATSMLGDGQHTTTVYYENSNRRVSQCVVAATGRVATTIDRDVRSCIIGDAWASAL